jgi:antirestriction protein ArdC
MKKTKKGISIAELKKNLTNKIINKLEQGIIPWRREWHGLLSGAYSRTTKRPYSFINQMLLSRKGEYLTFAEVKKLGGYVKKGAKAEQVVFYRPYNIKEIDDLTGEEVIKTIPLLKYYNVFHISDCVGIKPLDIKSKLKNDFDPVEEAENIIKSYVTKENITLLHKGQNRAYYKPTTDTVVLPLKEQFTSEGAYYSTAFHELMHSTGHKKRLNRLTDLAMFGSETYSKEELVAEVGAGLMMSYLGIETDKTFNNTVAYIQSWIKALKNDTSMIFYAAAKAEKAFNLILGKDPETEQEEN